MEKEMVDMRVQNMAPEPRTPSHKPKARKGKTLFIVCILAIPILNWLVFWFWVNIQSILLAFQIETVDGISFGLTHFADFWEAIVKENGDLGLSMKNTALYFLSSAVITMPLSLLISYFLSKKILGYQVFRIVLYLPCILSPIILTSIYDQFLSPRGPLGVLCQNLNLSYPLNGPLKTPESMLPTFTIIIYTILTGYGGDMLIFSGAMSRIPTEIYESAKLDGCGPLREVVAIVVPLVWSTISTKIVLLLSGIFSASGPILLLVTGKYNTSTVSFWIYNIVQKDGDYGIVAAAGLCFTAVMIPLILGVRALMEKASDVEY
jgi:ABC-type sugar transport system permease subunit